ncbi:MFS transporter [Granulosicoccaceae sp. 1_MG-2023]|nr:MFS transporter [Granulosicoccaceae sp. 1_MG-2023]
MAASSIAENIYEKLVNEEDARACRDIDANACREVPGNFVLMVLSHFFTKLGDAVANPKIVLPWILEAISAPLYLIGFLVPVRESGSLIPQLFIAGYVRRMPVRKWVWVAGSLIQALAMAAIGLVALTMEGAAGGWAVMGLLVVFSLARGMSSVAAKDVLGKTVPKSKRGRVNGWSASSAGLVTVALALALWLFGTEQLPALAYGAFLLGAAGLWVVAAAVYARIKEFPGETDGGKNAIAEAWKRLSILREDKYFRRFVITRSLLLCSALTAPYYVVLAQRQLGAQTSVLALFMLASGAASLLSAPFWGRFADVSSRKVMILAALMTGALGILLFLLSWLLPGTLSLIWVIPVFYFLLSIAHQGVRVGRKTYVVDLAEGNRRTDYVSVSNTVIGVVLLITGFGGALSTVLPVSGIILLLSLMGLAGAALGSALPEVE